MSSEAHERGIEAAADYYDSYEYIMLEHQSRQAVREIIKRYLEAGGLVVLPKEPTSKMLVAAAKAMSPGNRPTPEFVSNRLKHKFRYQAMVAAYKNFFDVELQEAPFKPVKTVKVNARNVDAIVVAFMSMVVVLFGTVWWWGF